MFSVSETSRTPAGLERKVDPDVIEPATGEAVDLVHDAVVDRVLLDVLQHPLELGPVGKAGRLAAVDADLDDVGAERFCLAQVRFTLCRD